MGARRRDPTGLIALAAVGPGWYRVDHVIRRLPLQLERDLRAAACRHSATKARAESLF